MPISLEKLKQYEEFFKRKEPKFETVKFKEAREILGQDALGPEEVKNAFGIELKPEQIPDIPYSKEDLEKAKQLGEMLVLRVDKAPDGEPLTMKKINELLIDEFEEKGKGKILYNTDWYKNEDFFTKDTPKLEWKLVSKEPIPDSTSKDYFKQTKHLRDHLVKNGFLKETDPEYIKDEEIEKIRKLKTKQEQAKALSELPINQKHRTIPVEDLYDLVFYFQTTGQYLRENIYNWTSRCVSDGELVGVGHFGFGSGGAYVDRYPPDNSYSDAGVCSAR